MPQMDIALAKCPELRGCKNAPTPVESIHCCRCKLLQDGTLCGSGGIQGHLHPLFPTFRHSGFCLLLQPPHMPVHEGAEQVRVLARPIGEILPGFLYIKVVVGKESFWRLPANGPHQLAGRLFFKATNSWRRRWKRVSHPLQLQDSCLQSHPPELVGM